METEAVVVDWVGLFQMAVPFLAPLVVSLIRQFMAKLDGGWLIFFNMLLNFVGQIIVMVQGGDPQTALAWTAVGGLAGTGAHQVAAKTRRAVVLRQPRSGR